MIFITHNLVPNIIGSGVGSCGDGCVIKSIRLRSRLLICCSNSVFHRTTAWRSCGHKFLRWAGIGQCFCLRCRGDRCGRFIAYGRFHRLSSNIIIIIIADNLIIYRIISCIRSLRNRCRIIWSIQTVLHLAACSRSCCDQILCSTRIGGIGCSRCSYCRGCLTDTDAYRQCTDKLIIVVIPCHFIVHVVCTYIGSCRKICGVVSTVQGISDASWCISCGHRCSRDKCLCRAGVSQVGNSYRCCHCLISFGRCIYSFKFDVILSCWTISTIIRNFKTYRLYTRIKSVAWWFFKLNIYLFECCIPRIIICKKA